MISLDRGFSRPVHVMLSLLICVTSTVSIMAGEKTVSIAEITDVDRVHLALVTVADAAGNPAAFNLQCFGTLLPDAGRAEGVNQIQEVAAQLAGLKESISPLTLGPITFRKIALSGMRPNLQATADLCCSVDGRPVVIPVKVDLVLTTISTRIASISDLHGDFDKLVEECHSLAASLRSSGWTPRGNLAPPQRSTYSPNLIRPKNISGSHARFNSTVSQAEFSGSDIFSRPYGVYSMDWDDWLPEAKREFMLVSDANWDRIIISSNAQYSSDWMSDYGSHGSGPGNFAHPAGIAFTPPWFIIADTYNNRAVVYELDSWELGTFEFQYELIQPGNVVDVAAARLPTTGYPKRKFAVLEGENCRVRIYDCTNSSSTLEQVFFSPGAGENQLDNPTSICYGRNKNTGFSMNYVYVADDGNKRIVGKSLIAPYGFFSTEGFVTFPEDAYLTSIDADYFGYLYVLDSYHGMIYKLDPTLQDLIATYGSLGTDDGSLWYPQRLGLATAWYSPETGPLQSKDAGDLLITERWGSQTGVRRYDQGVDVLSHWIEYIPMWDDSSSDFVRCHWYQTGVTNNRGALYLGGSPYLLFIDSFPQEDEQLPGDHNFSCNLTQLGSYYDHCWLKIEVEVASVYPGSNTTTFADSIWVDRYVDTTCIAYFDSVGSGKGWESPYVVSSTRSSNDVCVHYGDPDKWYWIDAVVSSPGDNCDDSWFYTRWITDNLVGPFFSDTAFGTHGQYDLLTNGLRAYFKLGGDPSWYLEPYEQYRYGTVMVTATSDTSANYWFTDTVDVDWWLWPNYCATSCTTCVQPPGCPMLYSWDGSQYVLENNLLPQSEESGRPQQDFTDVYPLDFAQVDQGQRYRFQITEDEQEQSKIRRLKLVALDVPQNTGKLILDNRHTLGALTGPGITPTSATTHDGQNVLAALSEADSVLFSSSEPGHIDLVYPVGSRNRDRMSLGSGPGGGPGPPPPNKNPDKVTSDGYRTGPNVYIISARNQRGVYEVVGKRHPRRRAMRRPFDVSDYVIDGVVHVRLAWTQRVELDHLPYLTYDRLDVVPQLLPLVEATHSDSGDVLSILSDAGSGFVSLLPGQRLDLAYQAPPLADSLKRVLLFRAVGRYESYVPPLVKPSETLPESFSFSQNYPNPFNPSTTFGFSLPNPAHVTLSVYNVLGQKVATVIDQSYTAGHHRYDWDGKDSHGQPLSSGVYFAQLVAGEYSSTKKMVVVK